MDGQFSSIRFFSFPFLQSTVIFSVRNVSKSAASSCVSGVIVGTRLIGNSG